MKKADFEKKMETLIRDLDEKNLEKMTRMIEQMKLERFESETLRKQQFAGILADTDLISVYLNFTRLTRPTDPFREGTILSYTGSEQNIIIPETIEGIPVKAIASSSFVFHTEITESTEIFYLLGNECV